MIVVTGKNFYCGWAREFELNAKLRNQQFEKGADNEKLRKMPIQGNL